MARDLIGAVNEDTAEAKLMAMTVEAMKMGLRLDAGRHYLMGTRLEHLTIEDTLEAFGFKRDGTGDAD